MKNFNHSKLLQYFAFCTLATLAAVAAIGADKTQNSPSSVTPVVALASKPAVIASRDTNAEPGMERALAAFFAGTHDCTAMLGGDSQAGDGLDPAISGRLSAVLTAAQTKGEKNIDTLNMLRAACLHHQAQNGGTQ